MTIREGLEFYNETISQVEKKLPELKGHPDILRKIYSVALELSIIYPHFTIYPIQRKRSWIFSQVFTASFGPL